MYFLRLPFKIVLFSVVVFALCRLALFLSYPDYFASLSFTDISIAFLQGFRFDLSTAVLSQALILLVLIIPTRFVQNRVVLGVLSWLSLLVLLVISAIVLADISYFSEVYRHMGAEISRLQNDYDVVLEIAITSRLVETLLGGIFLIGIVAVWYRLILLPIQSIESSRYLVGKWYTHVAASVGGFVVLLLMGRGLVLQSKPLDIVDAFSRGNQAQANLTLNGAFVAFKESRASGSGELSYLSADEMQKYNSQYAGISPFSVETRKVFDRKNVVFVLLESWSYKYIDGLANNGYGVTPFMDNLIEKSVVWDNFYAAGQRSILGIQAVLASVPVLSTQPVLGYGLELHNLSRLAGEAEKDGYSTLMVQSSNRRSFHMDGIARSLGFTEYYGKEDMPLLKSYPQDIPRFGWDYETLMFARGKISEIAQSEKNFFTFIFTGTTHEPFADPGDEFHVYPHSDSTEEGFLNTIRYSDWSIEQFMQDASRQDWYEDTVFVFSADHVLSAGTSDLKEQFHIPLIIFTPDGSLPSERRTEFASQYDLMPSMLELMGIETSVSSFGRSLWHDSAVYSDAYVSKGSVVAVLSEENEISFTEREILSPSALNSADLERLKLLQWRLQSADRSLRDNSWVKQTH